MIAEAQLPSSPARGRSGSAGWLTLASAAGAIDTGAERGKPERALDLGRHRPGAVALVVGDILQRRATRRPRPGERNEIASRQLVLPAPFGPTSTTTSPRACTLAAR